MLGKDLRKLLRAVHKTIPLLERVESLDVRPLTPHVRQAAIELTKVAGILNQMSLQSLDVEEEQE